MGRDDIVRDERLRLRGITGADWLVYAAVAAVALAIGFVNALSAAEDAARRGGAYDLETPLLWEMIEHRRHRPAGAGPVRRRPADAPGIPLAGSYRAGIGGDRRLLRGLHITGMVALRKLVMWMLGGAYDFHFSLAILIYEFRKDVVTCLLIGGACG